MEFLVQWPIDIEAETAQEAAEKALAIFREGNSLIFEVTSHDKTINETVDLTVYQDEPVKKVITLATLNDASLQEIFDQCKDHLLKQGRRADNFIGQCMYRSKEGLKCAIGCFISDEEYQPEMESNSIEILCSLFCLNISLTRQQLLDALQQTHDNCEPDEWKWELKEVAKAFKLDYSPEND